MNLQALDALGIKGKAFVLGTSQGGWICVRMALLAPEKIAGILPLGTSMDYESPRSRSLGCWDALDSLAATIAAWTSPTSDFEPTDEYCEFLLQSGFGGLDDDPEAKAFWMQHIKANYRGDEGRRRARMCAINLRDRDGLHSRLGDVKCPVWWMHGTGDQVYSVRNAEEEIELFTGVGKEDRRLVVVEGGQHFLSASHAQEVDEVLLEMIGKYGK
ncbi:hypothetical protein AC578_3074 [Pseudocercospora eumusae]|uniref:Serine aminopeptidase S33 domain-containing protein n=1 Tax=Pseudocercospora eumusae TaxID=321146 RepID=A0A139H413_9PEZI|nr:hypothetical protein AC578_3074 [Pseudocercospora eumusae]